MTGSVALSAVLEHKRAPYNVEVDSAVLLAFRNAVSASATAIDVVFVLDTSGSMAGQPNKRVRDVYQFLLDTRIRAGFDRVALITFDNEATLHFALTTDAAVWRQGSSKITCGSGTVMGPALGLAMEHVGAMSSPERRPLVVVMTDGITFLRKQLQEDWPRQLAVAAHCRPSVLTLGFTDEHDQTLLQFMVDAAPSGAYLSVPGLDQIVESLDCYFADHLRPVTVASAQLTLRTQAAVIGDARVGKGESFSRVSPNHAVITVTDVEEQRQRHFVVPLRLAAWGQQAAAEHVATVTVDVTLADGSVEKHTLPPLCIERNAASAAARTANDVNAGVVGEKARAIVSDALLTAYSSVRVKDTAAAVRAIDDGHARLDANALRDAAGAPVDTVATMVHRAHLNHGKIAVGRLAVAASKHGADDNAEALTAVRTATLAVLADIGHAELNERPSVLVPQYMHASADEQRIEARKAGLTQTKIEPDAAQAQALPDVLSGASTPIKAELVRFTHVNHFERTGRGGVQADLADLLLKRQQRVDDPNAGRDIEERILRNKAARAADNTAEQANRAQLRPTKRTSDPAEDACPTTPSTPAKRSAVPTPSSVSPQSAVTDELAAKLAKRRKVADQEEN